jgi:hypothetical protein
MASLLAALAPLTRLRRLALLKKSNLPGLLRATAACLQRLAQQCPLLQQLTLFLAVSGVGQDAWRTLQPLRQLVQLALHNTAPQPAWLCPSALPSRLTCLRLVNIGVAGRGVSVAQALPQLEALALRTEGDEWARGPSCALAVGSRLQALELEQVSGAWLHVWRDGAGAARCALHECMQLPTGRTPCVCRGGAGGCAALLGVTCVGEAAQPYETSRAPPH